MRYILCLIGTLFCLIASAQRIDNYSILFEIPDSSFVRIHYDNDLFQGQDIYYSQGIRLEIVNHYFEKTQSIKS